MKVYATIVLLTTVLTGYAQELPKKARAILEEGKLLYKSEMASWYGTDIFLEKYKDQGNIGGYFSYTDNGVAKCLFFSKENNPKVIGTIEFDSIYNVNTAKVDLAVKEFTPHEKDLYSIRQSALNEINSDTLFTRYENTNFNIIPIIRGKEKKVYILTGPSISGVVIFGNDYLITFDKKNKVVSKKRLHKNIIPIEYNSKTEDMEAMHSHLPETGEFMTATDICTILLYEKIAKMKSHTVVSKEYMNIWNCKTDELNVIPMETIRKINENKPNKE